MYDFNRMVHVSCRWIPRTLVEKTRIVLAQVGSRFHITKGKKDTEGGMRKKHKTKANDLSTTSK